jgi:hypothetical protein
MISSDHLQDVPSRCQVVDRTAVLRTADNNLSEPTEPLHGLGPPRENVGSSDSRPYDPAPDREGNEASRDD